MIGDGWKVHVLKWWDCGYDGKIKFGRAYCGKNGPAIQLKNVGSDCGGCILAR